MMVKRHATRRAAAFYYFAPSLVLLSILLVISSSATPKHITVQAFAPRVCFRRHPSILQQPDLSTINHAQSKENKEPQVPIAKNVSFDWKKEWYPLAPVQDLSRDTPNALTLLGLDLVVWHHQPSGRWKVFADVCPHRLVPLSEGRLEPSLGRLQCAYHGWEFDGNGSCVRIPQLNSIEPTDSSKTTASNRSCATAFPVQVAQGLLWVFATPNAELAATKAAPLIPQLDDATYVDATNFYVRDLPYSWDILVENLCDPSHIPFAHHGMINGGDRNKIEPMALQVAEENQEGFFAQVDPPPVAPGEYQLRFRAPCLLYYSIVNENNPSTYIGLGQYCVPTAPGRCRLIARFPFRLSLPIVMWMIRKTPRWITHLSQNIVLDSDVVFLTAQDERLNRIQKQKSNSSGSIAPTSYYMPAPCDVAVTAFRNWLGRVQSGPEWLDTPVMQSTQDIALGHSLSDKSVKFGVGGRTSEMRREDLLDRYHQHTSICHSCRTAHQTLIRLRATCRVVGVCALAVLASGFQQLKLAARLRVAFMAGLCLLGPQMAIRPLIARLEYMPWPRRKWQRPTTVSQLKSR